MFSKSGTKLFENSKKLNLNEKNSKWFSKRSRHLKYKVSLLESLRGFPSFLRRSAFSNFYKWFLVRKSQSSCTVWCLNIELKLSSIAKSFRTCSKIKTSINWISALNNCRSQEATKFLLTFPIQASFLIFNPFGIIPYDLVTSRNTIW